MNAKVMKKICSGVLMTTLPLVSGNIVYGAPGTLSDTPLFATNSSEPNIFFMMDDSGSMNTDFLAPEYVATWGGLMELSSDATTLPYRFVFGVGTNPNNTSIDNDYNDQYVIPTYAALNAISAINSETSILGAWRARNHDYNKQYYDPTKTYEVWTGYNNSGTKYSDITIDVTKTPLDPYKYNVATSSTYLDITANQTVTSIRPKAASEGGGSANITFTYYPATYWVWNDDNSDGIVDAAETKAMIEIKSGTPVCTSGTAASKTEQITDGCMLRSYTNEIKNFHNWFAYHRKREYSAKYAVSSVVGSTTGVRMGFATIHNTSASERKEMASMESTLTAPTNNKALLLNAMFDMGMNPNTPLIGGLTMAGQYFKCSGSANTPFGPTSSYCAIETTNTPPATEAPGACQQNFTVLISDGDYNDSASSTFANNDNDSSSWSGLNDATGNSYTFQFDGNPYADGYTKTLADVAMYYYEQDLNTTLANKVPVECGVDENPGQHMITYGVGFGVTGTIDSATLPDHPTRGYTGDSSCTSNVASASAFAWTDPTSGAQGQGKIDDFLHATYNGRGEYFSASDPDSLTTALVSTLRGITDRVGSASSVAFNSTSLDTGSVLYLALFDTGDWSGDLKAYNLDPNTGAVNPTSNWAVATNLDNRNLTATPRDIMTYDGTDGIAFKWANLTAAQQADLNINTTGGTDALGSSRLDYIRGDRTQEGVGNNFRVRGSRLGDIVHSTPVFVGETDSGWPDTAPFPTTSTYSSYIASTAVTGRTEILYVGSNDGMLHGFRANDGEEVFAYIPSYLFSSASATAGLHYLTNPLYSHRYFVDLPPSVGDAYTKTTTTGTVDWHTVLIGGTRGGARGIYALDITDPAKFDEDTSASVTDVVMWEFDSSDDADLGYTFSRPIVTLTNSVSGTNRWAAIFGNGYNNTGDGKAHLFVLFLDGGLDGTWTAGTDYIDIPLTIPSADGTDSVADPNGLSSPSLIDVDGNGTVDRVYAGDLKGHLWAIDLSSATASNWGSAYSSGSNDEPLFTAKNASGTLQPITATPTVVSHPTEATVTANSPNLLILFGTGQYLVEGDKTSTGIQTFYGVWDGKQGGLTRSKLVGQSVITGASATNRVLTDNSVPYSATGPSKRYGWYYDFDSTSSPTSGELGERVISKALIYNNNVVYFSMIPSIEPCDYGGNSWVMFHKIENGGRPGTVPFDANNDGVVNDYDMTTISGTAYAVSGRSIGGIAQGEILGNRMYVSSTNTSGGDGNLNGSGAIDGLAGDFELEDLSGTGTGRLSWEELLLD